MAPVRTSRRHQQQHDHQDHQLQQLQIQPELNVQPDAELFLDLMHGTPLPIYVDKDVDDREQLVELITKYGGTVSVTYSGVPYLLVDPCKQSGQSLFRQYASKKGKIVLDSRWVHECIKIGELQTFHTNWAGCKVTGNELVAVPPPPQIPMAAPAPPPLPVPVPVPAPVPIIPPVAASNSSNFRRRPRPAGQPDLSPVHQAQPIQAHTQPMAAPVPAPPPAIPQGVPTMVHHAQHGFPYTVFVGHPRPLHPGAGPPQTWEAPNGIAPQQTHIAPQQTHLIHRPQPHDWGPYDSHPHAEGMDGQAAAYRYQEEQPVWPDAPTHSEFYDPAAYDPQYPQPSSYIEQPPPQTATPVAADSSPPQPVPVEPLPKPRGRKRMRAQPTPAAPASALVLQRDGPARSPTPPSRVIKSTYGGNLFTSDDVDYLKKYIDFCQVQGLVLSLREICERIAIRAPHHTFYSWRRYCNKHQIRLGGYAMAQDRAESPVPPGIPEDEEEASIQAGPGPGTVAAAQSLQAEVQAAPASDGQTRNRSPSPPRALFRSTTGKGVAFTDEDVSFLVRFMEYRKSQGRLDMVAFWKDVATKAPHHSRASWMKYWRRHKHELNRTDTDEPLPQPPDKKMRYSREDDVLLAKYFAGKPEGTSDKIFQSFARQHPHHPWKGWQEHHRIHKAKIDHLIEQIRNGENIDGDPGTEMS
ncbi:hypothetical protein HGRIS_002822 [Hohenbuehelia grisea]|uniref:BRCT domain-containing protein n=1 Tax=Hohenbuehelia grisea TaxID=104357 RepID=A0ABR3JLN5_9AGAR